MLFSRNCVFVDAVLVVHVFDYGSVVRVRVFIIVGLLLCMGLVYFARPLHICQ